MVPIYPLAKPNYSSTNDNMILMRDVYKILLKEFSPQDLLIVGDSAGGGMTLAFAQYLKSKKIKHPGNIVLISP
jgi:acetyl esterase/lipase